MAKKKPSKAVAAKRSVKPKARASSVKVKTKVKVKAKVKAKVKTGVAPKKAAKLSPRNRRVPVRVVSNPIRPARIEPIDFSDNPDKLKSPLSSRELKEYRQLLTQKRTEILGDMKSMSRDALNSDSANLSHMPLHMADVGSDNYEQELTLGLVESERRLLQEIDEAIDRIIKGTFGMCEATGKPIGKARLAAKPWAKHCIEYARQLDRYGRR